MPDAGSSLRRVCDLHVGHWPPPHSHLAPSNYDPDSGVLDVWRTVYCMCSIDAGLPCCPLATPDHSLLIIAPPPHTPDVLSATSLMCSTCGATILMSSHLTATFTALPPAHTQYCTATPSMRRAAVPTTPAHAMVLCPPPHTPQPSAAAYSPGKHDAHAMPGRIPDMTCNTGVHLLLLPIANAAAVAVAFCEARPTSVKFCPHLTLAPTTFLSHLPHALHSSPSHTTCSSHPHPLAMCSSNGMPSRVAAAAIPLAHVAFLVSPPASPPPLNEA
ncbi:hypothetical protein B0H14DRAFT_3468640 [Mycena olivaceomarginata]|nr:hypothetical protein B0H14DRAFT_3468640 [Mycena olivaceomarginata]